MGGILKEDTQIKVWMWTEGGGGDEERMKERSSPRSNSAAFQYFSRLPQSHCSLIDKVFFFDSKLRGTKPKKNLLSLPTSFLFS
jgi:hypothetical protein